MAGELSYAQTQGDPNKLWMGDVSIRASFVSLSYSTISLRVTV